MCVRRLKSRENLFPQPSKVHCRKRKTHNRQELHHSEDCVALCGQKSSQDLNTCPRIQNLSRASDKMAWNKGRFTLLCISHKTTKLSFVSYLYSHKYNATIAYLTTKQQLLCRIKILKQHSTIPMVSMQDREKGNVGR